MFWERVRRGTRFAISCLGKAELVWLGEGVGQVSYILLGERAISRCSPGLGEGVGHVWQILSVERANPLPPY